MHESPKQLLYCQHAMEVSELSEGSVVESVKQQVSGRTVTAIHPAPPLRRFAPGAGQRAQPVLATAFL